MNARSSITDYMLRVVRAVVYAAVIVTAARAAEAVIAIAAGTPPGMVTAPGRRAA